MLKLSEVKGMTKQELLNIVLEGESSSGIDFAVPQGWLDEVSQQDPAKYDIVRSCTVWDCRGSGFGAPMFLTLEALNIYREYLEVRP